MPDKLASGVVQPHCRQEQRPLAASAAADSKLQGIQQGGSSHWQTAESSRGSCWAIGQRHARATAGFASAVHEDATGNSEAISSDDDQLCLVRCEDMPGPELVRNNLDLSKILLMAVAGKIGFWHCVQLDCGQRGGMEWERPFVGEDTAPSAHQPSDVRCLATSGKN